MHLLLGLNNFLGEHLLVLTYHLLVFPFLIELIFKFFNLSSISLMVKGLGLTLLYFYSEEIIQALDLMDVVLVFRFDLVNLDTIVL